MYHKTDMRGVGALVSYIVCTVSFALFSMQNVMHVAVYRPMFVDDLVMP